MTAIPSEDGMGDSAPSVTPTALNNQVDNPRSKSEYVQLPRYLAERLEELAAEAELDSYASVAEAPTNRKLNALATALYQTMHWYNSPECRRNHKSWNPEATDE